MEYNRQNFSKSIAIYLPDLRGGGAERMMVNLANEFVDRDVDTTLVLSRAEGPYLSDVAADVEVVDLEAGKAPVYHAMGAFRPIRRYLKREEPDVFLSSLTRANAVALLAYRTVDISTRVAVCEHNTMSRIVEQSGDRRMKALPWLAKATYRWADDIVTVSEGVAGDLSDTTGISRSKMTTIYNPVVTETLHERALEECPHPWLDIEGPPVILGAGSLTPQKDFSMLIRAFNHVADERDSRLVIISEGEKRNELETLIDRLNLGDCVDLPGFVDNPYSYMRAADVFALSSAWEGLPTVLIEAMACGSPVVSTDCPSGPREILEDGRYGPLVSVGDDEALAEAILQTLESPPDSELLKGRATDFSVERSADRYLDLLLGSPMRTVE